MAEYDDGAYYEVQLNNKQLVFFFMATLAIAVVVFLCGVMVGRGVRDATLAAAQNEIAAGPRSRSAEVSGAAASGTPRLDYTERLESEREQNRLDPSASAAGGSEKGAVPSENPETVTESATRPRTTSQAPPPSAAPSPSKPRPTMLGTTDGAFTIQVVALKTEDAAQSLLNRLKNKNYRAYLEAGGEAGLHRVRVGRFTTRDEAERVAQKLRDEEKFKPYITQ